MNQHNIRKWKNERFPSWIQEGWIRPQFSFMRLTTCGDGVVKAKSEWLISTTSPKTMKLTDNQDNNLIIMDLDTPPEPGGEIFDSLI
jgi:hypothetical protein